MENTKLKALIENLKETFNIISYNIVETENNTKIDLKFENLKTELEIELSKEILDKNNADDIILNLIEIELEILKG